MRAAAIIAVGFSASLLTLGCTPASDGKKAPPATPVPETESTKPSAPQPHDATPTSTLLSCPDPQLRGPGYPPWEQKPGLARCIEGPEGRWFAEEDSSDAEGWTYVLSFDGRPREDSKPEHWELDVVHPTGMARRRDGHLVLIDLKQGVSLISPKGKVVWKTTHPDCGAVDTIAVGWDDAITFSCGYSLLRFDRDGALQWQKWPFGDTHLRGPWVDREGILYVSGEGTVAALDSEGRQQWTFSTGSNRATGTLVWNAAGNLVFDTSMAARHTPGPVRRYFPRKPKELFELTRAGELVWRKEYHGDPPPGGWPEVLPMAKDGAHRVPEPGGTL